MILNGLVTLLFFVIRLLCGASYCFRLLSKGGAKFYFSFVCSRLLLHCGLFVGSRGESGMTEQGRININVIPKSLSDIRDLRKYPAGVVFRSRPF